MGFRYNPTILFGYEDVMYPYLDRFHEFGENSYYLRRIYESGFWESYIEEETNINPNLSRFKQIGTRYVKPEQKEKPSSLILGLVGRI